MADIQRTVLFNKLNEFGYKTLENAVLFCKMRGNSYVEFIHWIHQIVQSQDSDFHHIAEFFQLNISKISSDIVNALEKLTSGASNLSDLSPKLDEIMENSWKYSTLLFNDDKIRLGYIIFTILNIRHLSGQLLNISGEFKKIKPEVLSEKFFKITELSPEKEQSKKIAISENESSDAMSPAVMNKQEALKLYTMDITEKARNNELDPIIGRDDEIRQIIDILLRRRQNNPILVGEPGVGKSAVIEGLAQKIVNGNVPPSLSKVTLRTLDIGLLQAGASVKGEFENRLKQLIEEVQTSSEPIILFIDEAHTLIGAGGSAGTGDAANLLKPALARGSFKTIAATTWSEYKKYIEKDAALTRRFQTVKIDEPSEEKALNMLRGLVDVMEKHHKVLIFDEALETAVKLSHRYITDRQLPDKAISLLDTASARVAISQNTVPSKVENLRDSISNLENELKIIEKENTLGKEHNKRIKELESTINNKVSELNNYEEKVKKEKLLVEKILELRSKLSKKGINTDDTFNSQEELDKTAGNGTAKNKTKQEEDISKDDELFKELKVNLKKLSQLQGENPLIFPQVDSNIIGNVVSDWTGVPTGKMVKNEIESVLKLSDTLAERVVGQDHAMSAIAKRIQTSRAGVDNPNRPIGVFMLVGPSGVGKTESALALSEALYGGEKNLITINMSEFQEAHTVSTLKGAPPGYVGYGEGGVLTEAVRRRPYSVILLDEVEKAHSDVHEIFFQVFDKGVMEDGEGRKIDFKNTIILLTSNVGTDLIMDMCEKSEKIPSSEEIATALKSSLLKVFPAALLGRLNVVPYYPISYEMLDMIIRLQLDRIKDRLLNNRNITLKYNKAVIEYIASKCNDADSGARMVDAILTHDILPEISTAYLKNLAKEQNIKEIALRIRKKELFFNYTFTK